MMFACIAAWHCTINKTDYSCFFPARTTQPVTTRIAAAMPTTNVEDFTAFEDSKMGVKGLVDSGLTSIPKFFIHPQETLSTISSAITNPDIIPTVDLSAIDDLNKRPSVVQKIATACRKLGFFQVVNHGIPIEVMDRVIKSVKEYHEQPAEVKSQIYYRKHVGNSVSYYSNLKLSNGESACWRSITPEVCRKEVLEWNAQAKWIGEILMKLLFEGLGLDSSMLKEMKLLEAGIMNGSYYPCCPQPHLTLGIPPHADPGVLTVLIQDSIGGLQMNYKGEWIDVKPVPGALVINVNNILQMLSNDEYTSAVHRVLANPCKEPRTSVAVILYPGNTDDVHGPLPGLISPEKPARFRKFAISDYLRRFYSRDTEGKSVVDYYRQ